MWFDVKPHYEIDGFADFNTKKPFTLLYFEPRMQEIYRSWAKQLLTTKSPYSGKTLADEPALAIIEIQNEDSFFFWTFNQNNVPPVHWKKLESLFSIWLTEKYKTKEAVLKTWEHTSLEQDDPNQFHFGLYDAWHMTGDAVRQASAGKKKRTGDQVEFLTALQRSFYEETKSYFKDDLGSQSLVSASNWHVTDASMLDALERYSYTAGDVIDTHGYFGGAHNSPDGSHSYTVRSEHTFENLSALTVPETLPLQFFQVKDYPQIISDIGWTNPNLYRADYAFLSSAYSALQGVDGIFTFALGGAFWDTTMHKFALSSPVIMGNFPAYALLYRRGDVQEAKTVVDQQLRLNDLYAMKGSGGSSAQAFDAFRKADIPPEQAVASASQDFDPLSFYAGKVERSYDNGIQQTVLTNLDDRIDREQGLITSLTNELVWEYKHGIAHIHTPRCVAATGFLKKNGAIKFKDVLHIQCQNEYASIAVISLDHLPLTSSKNILIQTMTAERPYGFRASNGKDGTITNMGSYPFGVERIDASIEVLFGEKITAYALDENGMKRNRVEAIKSGNKTHTIKLDDDAVYHVIQIEHEK